MKLPKQWKHWLKSAGLKLYSKYYLKDFKGKGHVFRVTNYGCIDCSGPIEDFDRWGNSHASSDCVFPNNRDEFIKTIDKLIKTADLQN